LLITTMMRIAVYPVKNVVTTRKSCGKIQQLSAVASSSVQISRRFGFVITIHRVILSATSRIDCSVSLEN